MIIYSSLIPPWDHRLPGSTISDAARSLGCDFEKSKILEDFHHDFKRAYKWLQDGPRWLQDVPKWPQKFQNASCGTSKIVLSPRRRAKFTEFAQIFPVHLFHPFSALSKRQDDARWHQNGTKRAPRWLQDGHPNACSTRPDLPPAIAGASKICQDFFHVVKMA